MRNLIPSQIHKENLLSSLGQTSKPLFAYFDEINSFLFIIASDMKVYIFEYKSQSISKLFKVIELELSISDNTNLLMNIMSSIDSNENPFRFLTYKPELESVIIAIESGDIITLPISEAKASITSLVQNEKAKLIAMEASPNQEHIVCVLSNYTLLLLSYDTLTIINQCAIDDGDLSKVEEGKQCEHAAISFKQSGDLFCVGYAINGGYKCLVRDMKLNIMKGPARADNKIVFSVAEAPLDYMANFASFQPNGSLIAFFDYKNKNIFFSEKNCLIHGKFNITTTFNKEIVSKSEIKPILLKWNFESPMILFAFKCEDKFYIQIYHRSNYEWNLKYEKISEREIINAKFSDLISNELLLYYIDNSFEITNFVWEYSSSLLYGNNHIRNSGEICVLDNNCIKYSPLGIVNIPPPMALVTIQESKGKKFFWFKNFFFALYHDGVEVYKSEKRTFVLFAKLNLKIENFDINLVKKIIYVPCYKMKCGVIVINAVDDTNVNQEKIIFVSYSVEYTDDEYKTINTFLNENNPIDVSTKIINEANKGIIFNSVKYERSYIKSLTKEEESTKEEEKPKQMNLDMLELDHIGQNTKKETNDDDETDGVILYYANNSTKSNEISIDKISYDITTHEMNKHSLEYISHPNENERIINISSCMTYNNKEIIIYLTHNHKLYQNSKLLSTDINSYLIFKHFLLFTQISSTPYSTLHIIDLNSENILSKFDPNLYIQNLNYKNFNMRTLERGSQIVTCSGINVILQMPRGNLETISPRLIVLDEIQKLVNEENYETAFVLARKHKINLNFIYDINPDKFLNNIRKFISQVNKQDYINLFINSLSNTTCEEYQILYETNKTKEIENDNKVNTICQLIRKTLLEFKDEKYINSVLISYTKQTPPMHLEALKLVQKLKIENNAKADKALEFLCWIVKADTLFDFALKTYDFELVIMCAKHTNKDPKEYLSYLNSLEEIKKKDIILMKYQINMDQKYYNDALIELSKGGDKYFDKCLDLIIKHNLFILGLSLFNQPIHEALYMKIYDAKGDYFFKEKNFMQASTCYMRCHNYPKALQCYIETGQVNEALTLLTTEVKLNEENVDLYDNIMTLLEICKTKKLASEIEKVYTYLITQKTWLTFSNEKIKEISIKMIESLVQIKSYTKAYFICMNIMRILSTNDKYSNIPLALSQKLYEEIDLCYNLYSNNLIKNKSFFDEKYARLLKVQELKREHPELFIIDINKNDNEQDNVSDSGSVRSQSNKSSKSTLSRKTKMRKPKRNVREGSPMEEENLIGILKDLKISQDEINGLIELGEVLLLCKFNAKAEELIKQKDLYVQTVNAKISNLFSIEQVNYIKENPIIHEIFPDLPLGNLIPSQPQNKQTNK